MISISQNKIFKRKKSCTKQNHKTHKSTHIEIEHTIDTLAHTICQSRESKLQSTRLWNLHWQMTQKPLYPLMHQHLYNLVHSKHKYHYAFFVQSTILIFIFILHTKEDETFNLFLKLLYVYFVFVFIIFILILICFEGGV